MKYRPEIDGLRTVAVVPVVLFHAGIAPFTGGFVGVDVFFVISGYLISRIILDEASAGRFSILRFYERRARRILPALFLVMLCCLPLAWRLMNGPQIRDFGQSLVATALFASNVLFWKESGYFEQAAELKPLLHTWSLAVEEQFYLIYPLAAVLLVRCRVGIMRGLLGLAIVASLVLAQVGTSAFPAANFYLLPSRIWELLAGALCSALPAPAPGRRNDLLGGLGLVLIAVPVFAYGRFTPFPGLSAVPPVLGTALVLRHAVRGTLAARLLSWRVFVGIGLVSYSFYLWHQPVFAFARLAARGHPPAWQMLLLSALSLGLAWGTWRFVETPFRQGRVAVFARRRGVFATSLVGLVIAAGAGAVLAKTDLPKLRHDRALVGALADVTNVYQTFDYNAVVRNGTCHSVDEAALRGNGCLDLRAHNLILWGDSYAAALYSGLAARRDADHPDWGVTQLTDGNGPPFWRDDRRIDGGARTLTEANDLRLRIAQEIRPEVIVLGWFTIGPGAYATPEDTATALAATIARIRAALPQTRIAVVGPVPFWQGTLLDRVMDYAYLRREPAPNYIDTGLSAVEFRWDAELQARDWGPGVTYLSAMAELCRPDGACLAHASDDPADLSTIDWGHLTRSGSTFLIGRLEPRLFR